MALPLHGRGMGARVPPRSGTHGLSAEDTRRAPVMKHSIKHTATAPRAAPRRGRPRREVEAWKEDLSFEQAFAEEDFRPAESEADSERSPLDRELSNKAGGDGASADDALTLYLKQMGAIPLLKPAQERELTQRVETARRRYRHPVFFNWERNDPVREPVDEDRGSP